MFSAPVTGVSVYTQPVRGFFTSAYFVRLVLLVLLLVQVMIEFEDGVEVPLAENGATHTKEFAGRYSTLVANMQDVRGHCKGDFTVFASQNRMK